MSAVELLTVQETADLLRVSAVTVRRHIAAGRLRAVRIGGRVRVDREQIGMLIKPVGVKRRRATPRKPKFFTMDDPLWKLIGAFKSDGPTDVSANKHEYLAEAYADLHEDR
jgi:excisionase family DNA binding protein